MVIDELGGSNMREFLGNRDWLVDQLQSKNRKDIALELQYSVPAIDYWIKKHQITSEEIETNKAIWYDDTKSKVRAEICSSNKSYNCVLLLPSSTALDVDEMLSNGALTKSTSIIAIERDLETADILERKLKRLEIPHVIHRKFLHEVDLSGCRIDFAYIDTCGQLTAPILKWLVEQVQKEVFTGRIVLAFSHFARGGYHLLEKFVEYSKDQYLPAVAPVCLSIDSVESQLDQHQVMALMLSKIFGELKKSYIYRHDRRYAIPMHVFEFRARKGLAGVGFMIQFLKSVNSTPAIYSPGLKAWTTRSISEAISQELS